MKSHLNRPEVAKKALAADICDYLNELLEADSPAVRSLFDTHVPCNCALEMHPTAQVGPDGVGFLGVINGLIGVDSSQWGYIEGIYDDDGVLQRFSARYSEGDRRMAPGVAVSGRSCEACKLEAQIGTEEVPHPIDARLHTCKMPAPTHGEWPASWPPRPSAEPADAVDAQGLHITYKTREPIPPLPNQLHVYQQLTFPAREEVTGVEKGELYVAGAPPKYPRTPGIFATQLQQDLEQARAEEDAAVFAEVFKTVPNQNAECAGATEQPPAVNPFAELQSTADEAIAGLLLPAGLLECKPHRFDMIEHDPKPPADAEGQPPDEI